MTGFEAKSASAVIPLAGFAGGFRDQHLQEQHPYATLAQDSSEDCRNGLCSVHDLKQIIAEVASFKSLFKVRNFVLALEEPFGFPTHGPYAPPRESPALVVGH
jgi:hypothetical protein